MSDRRLGPDEPAQWDWDSIFRTGDPREVLALPSGERSHPPVTADDESRLATPAKLITPVVVTDLDDPLPQEALALALDPVDEPAPLPLVIRSTEVHATRHGPWGETVRRPRSTGSRRAAVTILVLGWTVLMVMLSQGPSPRSGLVRSAAPGPVKPAEPPSSSATTAQVPVLPPSADSSPATTSSPAQDVPDTPSTTVVRRAAVATTRPTAARSTGTAPTTGPTAPPTSTPAVQTRCGLVAGSSVDVDLNGRPLGVYRAGEDGCVKVPVE